MYSNIIIITEPNELINMFTMTTEHTLMDRQLKHSDP